MSGAVGLRLKSARGRLGLTLRALEQASGVSNAYISQLENGVVKEPSCSVVQKLASGIGCDPAWLAFGSHNWVKDQSFYWCMTCGFVKRKDGRNKDCSGPTLIDLRSSA